MSTPSSTDPSTAMGSAPAAPQEPPVRRARVAAAALAAILLAGVVSIALVGRAHEELPVLPVLTSASSSRSETLAEPVQYALATVVDVADKGPAYRLGVEDGEARAATLAGVLAVSGEVGPADNGWEVSDGERTLRVENLPGLPWSLAPAGGRTDYEEDPRCTMPDCPEGTACAQVCPDSREIEQPPSRPEGLPARGDAETIARGVFDRLGVDAPRVEVIDARISWEVIVDPRIGGLPTVGMTHSLTIGPEGKIVGGNGYLDVPDRLGDYPLIGVDVALDRLQDESGGEVGPGTKEVSITAVNLGLALMADHLVPSFLFTAADGLQIHTIAVADAYLSPSPAIEPQGEP